MKKIGFNGTVIAVLLLTACAAVIREGFKEPTSDDTILLIGSILIEDNYFTKEPDVYRKEIEVAVLGKTDEGKTLAYWTTSDENGFFSIGDVPKGMYALKGFRALLKDGSYVTVTNRLNYVSDNYLLAENELVIFEGSYLPVEPVARIANFQHNHFILTQMSQGSRIVDHSMYYTISGEKLVNGEEHSAQPVAEYFLGKYPDSEWADLLQNVR